MASFTSSYNLVLKKKHLFGYFIGFTSIGVTSLKYGEDKDMLESLMVSSEATT